MAVLAITILCLVGWTGVAPASTSNFSGQVTTADQPLTDCNTNYSKIFAFRVTATGTYSLNNLSPTAAFNGPTFFYAGVFTSFPSYVLAHPDRLFLVNNSLVLTGSGTLNTGTTYFLVVGGSAGCGTVYPVSYSFSMSSTVGDVELLDRPNGDSCTDPTQCLSQFCADGVCCDTACDAASNRCDVVGQVGTCVESGVAAPTVDHWGLLVEMLLLGSVAAVALRRSRP